MKDNNKKFNIKVFWKDFLNRVYKIYFYLLLFYTISKILAYFFISLNSYFNWRAFDFFVAFFTVLFFLHPNIHISFKKISKLRIRLLEDLAINLKSYYSRIFIFIKWLFLIFKLIILKLFFLIKKDINVLLLFLLNQFKKIDWNNPLIYKLLIILLVSIFFLLFRSIILIDFIVLIYALFSVLFIVNSKISFIFSLFSLFLYLFLIIIQKERLAELMAIYSYYFLLITSFVGVMEYLRDKKLL